MLAPARCIATLALVLAACGGDSGSAAPDAAPAATVEIEYVAHACFRLHADDGTTILIDPFASKVWLGYDFPASLLTTANVLITHPHYDHDFGEFIGQAVPWTMEQTVVRDPGESDIGPFHVTGIAGKHHDPYGTEFGQKNTVFLIEVAGLRIAHLGDNAALSPELIAGLGHVDVLLAPIDGNEHILTYAELATIRDQLTPSVVIPMHYRLPDLETSATSPEDLGEIDPWLAQEPTVTRVGASTLRLSTGDLPTTPTVMVLDHSPLVTAP